MVTIVWNRASAALRALQGGPLRSSKRLATAAKREDGSAQRRRGPTAGGRGSESDDELRTVTLPRRQTSAPATAREGGFGHDSVRVAANGTVAACCVAPWRPDRTRSPCIAMDARFRPPRSRTAIEFMFANAAQLILGVMTSHGR